MGTAIAELESPSPGPELLESRTDAHEPPFLFAFGARTPAKVSLSGGQCRPGSSWPGSRIMLGRRPAVRPGRWCRLRWHVGRARAVAAIQPLTRHDEGLRPREEFRDAAD